MKPRIKKVNGYWAVANILDFHFSIIFIERSLISLALQWCNDKNSAKYQPPTCA